MNIEQIVWEPVHEKHQLGNTSRGKVWIRYDKEEKPVSIYLKLDTVDDKQMCDAWLEIANRNGDAARDLAQMLFENVIKAEEIISKNNKHGRTSKSKK